MTQTPAGWHPDPQDPSQLRYWDGTQWTEHRSPAQGATQGAAQSAAQAEPTVAMTPMPQQPASPKQPGSKRTLWLTLGGVALLVAGCSIGAAAAGGGDDNGKAADASATVTVTAKPEGGDKPTVTVTETVTATPDVDDEPAVDESNSADDAPAVDDGTKPSLKLPKQNGDWRLDTLQLKDDGIGDFAGLARVTYTGEDTSGGDNIFTVTLFEKDGETIITTLTGSASDVKPGQTVTVDFFSLDGDYKAGKFPFTFQNDL